MFENKMNYKIEIVFAYINIVLKMYIIKIYRYLTPFI
jgi:hypothetical protein